MIASLINIVCYIFEYGHEGMVTTLAILLDNEVAIEFLTIFGGLAKITNSTQQEN